jgi:hypothetical protein
MLWIDLDGLVVCINGLIAFALVIESSAFVVPGLCKLWIDLNGCVIYSDGFIVFALAR